MRVEICCPYKERAKSTRLDNDLLTCPNFYKGRRHLLQQGGVQWLLVIEKRERGSQLLSVPIHALSGGQKRVGLKASRLLVFQCMVEVNVRINLSQMPLMLSFATRFPHSDLMLAKQACDYNFLPWV